MILVSFSLEHLCGLASAVLSTLVVLSAFTVKGTSAAATGCTTCGMPAMEKGTEERYLVEMAKQQILSKLHLRERPNITQTVPRAALMTALRKLHAGRFRQDGTLELDNNGPNSHTNNQAYEIVSFADVGECIWLIVDRSILKTFSAHKLNGFWNDLYRNVGECIWLTLLKIKVLKRFFTTMP